MERAQEAQSRPLSQGESPQAWWRLQTAEAAWSAAEEGGSSQCLSTLIVSVPVPSSCGPSALAVRCMRSPENISPTLAGGYLWRVLFLLAAL